MAQRFRRRMTVHLQELEPGEYCKVDPGFGWAVIRCPTCRGLGTISRGVHQVGGQGEVTPSVVCGGTCSFHEWVVLGDWEA